jgi:hypothetical protein
LVVKQHRSIPPAKQEILLEGNVICQRSSFINISVFLIFILFLTKYKTVLVEQVRKAVQSQCWRSLYNLKIMQTVLMCLDKYHYIRTKVSFQNICFFEYLFL